MVWSASQGGGRGAHASLPFAETVARSGFWRWTPTRKPADELPVASEEKKSVRRSGCGARAGTNLRTGVERDRWDRAIGQRTIPVSDLVRRRPDVRIRLSPSRRGPEPPTTANPKKRVSFQRGITKRRKALRSHGIIFAAGSNGATLMSADGNYSAVKASSAECSGRAVAAAISSRLRLAGKKRCAGKPSALEESPRPRLSIDGHFCRAMNMTPETGGKAFRAGTCYPGASFGGARRAARRRPHGSETCRPPAPRWRTCAKETEIRLATRFRLLDI